VHVELLFLEGEFDRTFRMQPASLEKLLQKLAPSLLKSTPHNGPFGVEFVKPETVMMALRWLAGGNYDDIRLVAGCSVMSLFRLLCTHGKLCSQSLQTCQISDVCWERQAL
jgi:hypothetical protein